MIRGDPPLCNRTAGNGCMAVVELSCLSIMLLLLHHHHIAWPGEEGGGGGSVLLPPVGNATLLLEGWPGTEFFVRLQGAKGTEASKTGSCSQTPAQNKDQLCLFRMLPIDQLVAARGELWRRFAPSSACSADHQNSSSHCSDPCAAWTPHQSCPESLST